jgi:hypothetical protein
MSREPDEAADVALAETLVFGRPSLTLERYSRAETLAGRTPDFKVLEGRALKAFCEVKSPRDDWLDEQLDQTDAFEIAGGLRADPVFSRIARHVKKAASQFEAVNPDHDLPNILVFVNHAIQIGPNDLYETLTGYARTEGGGKIATMTHIAEWPAPGSVDTCLS